MIPRGVGKNLNISFGDSCIDLKSCQNFKHFTFIAQIKTKSDENHLAVNVHLQALQLLLSHTHTNIFPEYKSKFFAYFSQGL